VAKLDLLPPNQTLGAEGMNVWRNVLAQLDVHEENGTKGNYIRKNHCNIPPLIPTEVYLEVVCQDLLPSDVW
jgi:hypothetical protein